MVLGDAVAESPPPTLRAGILDAIAADAAAAGGRRPAAASRPVGRRSTQPARTARRWVAVGSVAAAVIALLVGVLVVSPWSCRRHRSGRGRARERRRRRDPDDRRAHRPDDRALRRPGRGRAHRRRRGRPGRRQGLRAVGDPRLQRAGAGRHVPARRRRRRRRAARGHRARQRHWAITEEPAAAATRRRSRSSPPPPDAWGPPGFVSPPAVAAVGTTSPDAARMVSRRRRGTWPASGASGSSKRALAGLDRVEQVDRDVGDLDLSSTPGGLHAVVEHDVAERAGGGDAGGAGRQRLRGPLVVDLDADRLLHPHAGPAGAAAHPLRAVARHLDDLDALDRADHLARREVHVVVAAEVARVVVGDPLLERRLADVEPPVGDQLLEQLACGG